MNDKPFYNIVLPLVLLSAILFPAIESAWYRFFPKAKEYGISYNAERVKRGILPLPENWTSNDFDKSTKTWKPAKLSGPRTSKIVGVDEEGIDFELDYLFKDHVNMEIIYNYRDSANPWEISLQSGNEVSKISKEQADSLMLIWRVGK